MISAQCALQGAADRASRFAATLRTGLGTVSVARTAVRALLALGLAAPGPSVAAELRSEPVTRLVEQALEQNRIAGASVVVIRDGRLIHMSGHGFADAPAGRRASADTLFHVASISKLMTYVAIAQLVSEGRISLDEPVQPRLDIPLRAGVQQAISFRQLLTHRSGMDAIWAGMWTTDPAERMGLAQFLQTHVPRQVAVPGAEVSYSNYAVALLGQVVASERKLSFDEAVRRHVFAPAGMTTATFARDPAAPPGPISLGHRLEGRRLVTTPQEFTEQVAPAASLRISATDMARFLLAMIARPSPLLDDSTRDMMLGPQARFHPGLPGMALGWFERDVPGRPRAVGHTGSVRAAFSDLLLFPDTGTAVYVAVNTENGSAGRSAIMAAILDHLLPPAEATVPEDRAVDDAAAYAGFYRTAWRPRFGFDAFAYVGQGLRVVLRGPDRLSLEQDGESLPLHAIGPDLFAIAPAPGVWARRIGFARNAAGAVTSAQLSSDPTEQSNKVPAWDDPKLAVVLVWLALLAAAAAGARLLAGAAHRTRSALLLALAGAVLGGAIAILYSQADTLLAGWYHGEPLPVRLGRIGLVATAGLLGLSAVFAKARTDRYLVAALGLPMLGALLLAARWGLLGALPEGLAFHA